MKSVAYHRLAANELIGSAEFYERRNPGLGEAFLSTVEVTLAKIQLNPKIGAPGGMETRSWKTKQFPFRIVYQERPDRIWVVAIAHLSRRPNYWLQRLR